MGEELGALHLVPKADRRRLTDFQAARTRVLKPKATVTHPVQSGHTSYSDTPWAKHI